MAKINSLDVLALAKFQAILFAFVGLAAGVVYSFGGLIFDLVTTGSLNLGTALAFLALIGMPLIFAVAGAVLGVFEAVLFNILARKFGGVKIDFIR
ncbi:MAG: ABC transporter ATP-binding protein [bacterium]|nr:ABC transporter ATP-binding protein [bacterium]